MKLDSYTQEHPTKCNICGGKVILLHTNQKFARVEYIYKCTQCGASVGTHPNDPNKALGTLADTELKSLRREAHVWFDKLWTSRENREELYERLAAELGIERKECHFGTLSKEQLKTAIDIIKKWWWQKFDK